MLPQGVVADHLDHLQPVSELNMASALMMTRNCNQTEYCTTLHWKDENKWSPHHPHLFPEQQTPGPIKTLTTFFHIDPFFI